MNEAIIRYYWHRHQEPLAGEFAIPFISEEARVLRAVVDTAVDGVIVIDAAGLVLMFNPACERLFGYTAQEVIGRNVKMLMPSPYREEHDRYIGNYLATARAKIIGIGREVTGRRKDGSTFPMDLSVGEAKREGQPHFVGIIHDLTERERTQRRMAEMQSALAHVARISAMGEMASALAHELNQPLTAVMNYARAVRRLIDMNDDRVRDRIFDAADKAIEQAGRAGQIIHHLRGLIRKRETEKEAVDANHVVREASGLALTGAREQGVAVRYELHPQLLPVFIDQIQIQQVVVNLVRNSVEAMQSSERREITIVSTPVTEGFIEIAVNDTGPGLPPGISENLFRPFVTTKANGMGIGLSISRSIIEAHGGQISASPNPGGGTSFRFTLPAAPAEGLQDGG